MPDEFDEFLDEREAAWKSKKGCLVAVSRKQRQGSRFLGRRLVQSNRLASARRGAGGDSTLSFFIFCPGSGLKVSNLIRKELRRRFFIHQKES